MKRTRLQCDIIIFKRCRAKAFTHKPSDSLGLRHRLRNPDRKSYHKYALIINLQFVILDFLSFNRNEQGRMKYIRRSGLYSLRYVTSLFWPLFPKLLFSMLSNFHLGNSKTIQNPYNENHGQWKRYQRHIANVSITPVIIISAFQLNCSDSKSTFCKPTNKSDSFRRRITLFLLFKISDQICFWYQNIWFHR